MLKFLVVFCIAGTSAVIPKRNIRASWQKECRWNGAFDLECKINLWRLTSWLYGPILPSCETAVVTVVPPVEFVRIVEF